MTFPLCCWQSEGNGVDEGRVDEGRVDGGRVDEGRVDEGRVDEGRVDEERVDEGRVDEGRGCDFNSGFETTRQREVECYQASIKTAFRVVAMRKPFKGKTRDSPRIFVVALICLQSHPLLLDPETHPWGISLAGFANAKPFVGITTTILHS